MKISILSLSLITLLMVLPSEAREIRTFPSQATQKNQLHLAETYPQWNPNFRYIGGEIVSYNSVNYRAKVIGPTLWNVNAAPPWTPKYWETFTGKEPPLPPPEPVSAFIVSPAPITGPAWSPTRRYLGGEIVTHEGITYTAKHFGPATINMKHAPNLTPDLWDVLSVPVPPTTGPAPAPVVAPAPAPTMPWNNPLPPKN